MKAKSRKLTAVESFFFQLERDRRCQAAQDAKAHAEKRAEQAEAETRAMRERLAMIAAGLTRLNSEYQQLVKELLGAN